MRILIVDDQVDNTAVLAALVRRCGHEPVIANSGHEALRLAENSPPDFVLMDIMMPKMDGYETSRRLRSELGLKAPIFALSAAEDIPAKSAAAGMTGYYRKPLGFAHLRQLIGD